MGTSTDQVEDATHHQESTPSSSQSDERKQLPNKLKYLTAAAIFYGNIAFGCAFNTYGPAITSLQNKYETDDATISKVFTILTACYMVGALTGGFIFNYVNRQLAVIAIVIVMCGMMLVTPHCPTMVTFFISAAVMGICSGSYDTAQFVWIMEMMQKDCPPYVQCQHFFYAVGANLASLIMAPFLDRDDDDDTTTTTTLSALSPEEHFPFHEGVIAKKAEDDTSKLFIPYTIVGILISINAIVQILLFVFMRYYPPPPEMDETVQSLQPDSVDDKRQDLVNTVASGFKVGSWSLAKLRIVILSTAFYGAYQGMEMCTFQFFPKFGQNSDLKLSESQSAYVLTGMTAAFAAGRGVAIFAVFKISTQLILGGNVILVFIANVILIAWAKSSLSMLWASSIIFGLGFSSMYASFSAYIERYLRFTNFIGSLMIVVGSGVAAIYPLIVGSFIENNVIVLSYTSFFSIFVIMLAFGTLSYLTHKDKTRH